MKKSLISICAFMVVAEIVFAETEPDFPQPPGDRIWRPSGESEIDRILSNPNRQTASTGKQAGQAGADQPAATTVDKAPAEIHPQIVRSQDDGRVYYQQIILKNSAFHFSENQKSLSCFSDLFNYDFTKDEKNNLARFRLNLQANTEQVHQTVPGSGSSIALSNSTLYQDLNGDSVLDTMVKHGPQGHGRYILYKNSWIHVNDSMVGFAIGSRVISIESKVGYVFVKNEWEIEK